MVLSSSSTHPSSLHLRDVLADTIDPHGPTLAPFEQAEGLLSRNRPQVLVVMLSPAPDRALNTLARVRNLASAVVAVGPSRDPQLILQALHEGADHYIDEADLAPQLAALRPRLSADKEVAPSKASGQVISLLSASGGSGASTLAANLAVVLAQEAQRSALLELKPGFGDLAALLDLKPTHTVADLCVNILRVDQAMFEKALVPHSSGVHLLAPPQSYDDVRLLTPQGIHKAVRLARDTFPFVVIDQEDCFHEEQILALRQADRVLLVARLDFTSLRNTRRLLDHLSRLDIPLGRVQLVINRHGQAKELPAGEVEPIIGLPISHLLPDDPRTVNGANNAGVPLVLKSPACKLAQCITGLGKSLLPTNAPARPPKPRSGFRWLTTFG
jgi:pilus assembly protein CpaE